MGYGFNPLIFTGLDLTGGGGAAGAASWREPVANEVSLPLVGNAAGDARVTLDTDKVYVWDAAASRWVDTGITAATFGSAPNAQGQTIGTDDSTANIRRRILTLQPADASNPGGVSTTTQSFSGAKTFLDAVKVDESSNQVILGTTTTTTVNAPNPIANRVITIPDAGTNSSVILTESNQTLNGTKTFSSTVLTNSGIDVTATAGTDTLTIGGTNADVINIGRSGATVNIVGTTLNQDVINLLVTDKNITLNSGGAAGSGATSGVDIEEAGSITGYVEVSADRNSWSLKAPNTVGVATLTPGASGITLNQSSHDPVTLAPVGSSPNSNASSLTGQQLTLQPANGTNPGVLTAGTQTIGGDKTFTGTITASNLSGTNTGNVTLAAVDSAPNANGATLVGQQLNLEPANASFPGVITAGTQTIGGAKTFDSLLTAQNSIALTGHVSSADYIDFTNGAGTAFTQGRLFYDHQANALSYYTDINGFRIHIGYENVIRARNLTGSTILKGKLVYVNGANGQYPTIALAKADSTSTAQVIAIVQQDVLDNDYTDVITFGVLENLNTFGYTAGQTVYLSSATAGELTSTPPTSPNYEVEVGVILYAHPTQGKILVNISTPKQKVSGDVSETFWSGIANNTLNQSITGLSFANAAVRGFKAEATILINATSNLYAKYTLDGIQKGASWEVSTEFSGDLVPGIAFNVTGTGQVQVSTGNISGFTSGSVHFRAQALSI